jgi:hypothetical protein
MSPRVWEVAAVIVTIIVLLLAQSKLWYTVANVRVLSERLERLEGRMERAVRVGTRSDSTLLQLQDALQSHASSVTIDIWEGVVVAQSNAQHSSGAPRVSVVSAVRALLQGRCRDSMLMVTVDGSSHLSLLVSSFGCTVLAFHRDPMMRRYLAISSALNASGKRVINEGGSVLIWNRTTTNAFAIEIDRASSVLHVTPAHSVSLTTTSWVVPTTTLASEVHQNIALLIVASSDWMRVLEGLSEFPHHVFAVLLTGPLGIADDEIASCWTFLEQFRARHGLLLSGYLGREGMLGGMQRIQTASALKDCEGVWLHSQNIV